LQLLPLAGYVFASIDPTSVINASTALLSRRLNGRGP
jgi:hypothetical protein